MRRLLAIGIGAMSATAAMADPPPLAPPAAAAVEQVQANALVQIGRLQQALGETQLQLMQARKEIEALRGQGEEAKGASASP